MRWFPAGEGQTPLDRDEARGLRFDVNTRGELDELEQINIVEALLWAGRRGGADLDLLSPSGLCRLHQRMFGDVWSWAGSFRSTEKNIGVAPHQVPGELKKACDDMAWWIGEGAWEPRAAAARYHHRLVRIHPFVKGNGRHARIVADLFLAARGAAPLSWPEDRALYIGALRQADARRYGPLEELLLRGGPAPISR